MTLHRTLLAAACVALGATATAALGQQGPAGNAEAARAKNSMCTGCHGVAGYKAAFPDVYHVPKIGGQQAVYLANALKAYRSGERKHPTMRSIAASLSDQDIADLAAYYSGGGK